MNRFVLHSVKVVSFHYSVLMNDHLPFCMLILYHFAMCLHFGLSKYVLFFLSNAVFQVLD